MNKDFSRREYFRLNESEILFGIAPGTVRKWIKRDGRDGVPPLQAFRPGKDYLINVKEMKKYSRTERRHFLAENYINYFISFKDGPIKIGKTTDLESRLHELQCACPFNLTVLGTVPSFRVTESQLHKQFKHLRMRGEWFRRESDLLKFIGENCG